MKKVKAVDIANHLGISKATVSLALNNRPGISENTRKKVLQCKKELEQKSVRTSGVIKLVTLTGIDVKEDARSPFFEKMLWGIEQALSETAYTLEVLALPDSVSSIYEAVRICNNEAVAGALLIFSRSMETLSAEQLVIFKQFNMSVIFYDSLILTINFDQVRAGNGAAVDLAARHLYRMGHRHIAYFYTEDDGTCYNLTRRLEAAKRCASMFREKGLRTDFICIRSGTVHGSAEVLLQYCRKNISEYLNRETDLPTGFVCDNYITSAATIEQLDQKGFKIPQQVSVIGIDPPNGLIKGKELTYVDLIDDRRGYFAVQRLIDRIEGRVMEHIVCDIAPVLVHGDTVGKRI